MWKTAAWVNIDQLRVDYYSFESAYIWLIVKIGQGIEQW